MRVLLFTEWGIIITLSSFIFCKINGDRKSLHLSTCIQLRMTKHPFQKAMYFRHLLSCDTIILEWLLLRNLATQKW